MNGIQERQALHQFINIADERMVKALYAMMQNYMQQDETIVAYATDGRPLTRADFVAGVKEAYAEATNGNLMTTEEVLQALKNR